MMAKAVSGNRIRCVVLIPVGPRTAVRHLNDTLLSILHFLGGEFRIVLIDNTVDGLCLPDLPKSSAIEILRVESSGEYTVFGRLYMNVSRAIVHILSSWDFDILLRMDDDALLVGDGAEEDAMEAFKANPGVGCLGSYRFTCMGAARDFGPSARRVYFETSIFGRMLDRSRWHSLNEICSLAESHGYEAGEHCLGAACFYRREVLVAMRDKGLLSRSSLLTTRLCDDQLFGILVRAAGYQMMDFAGPGQPLGLAWKGLPASPRMLLAIRKKIVHSVKSAGEADQDQIRHEFARLRERAPSADRMWSEEINDVLSSDPAAFSPAATLMQTGTRL